MKLLAILGFIFFVSLVFPTSTCPDCAAFNDALQGQLSTYTDSYGKVLEIYAYYENNTAPVPRVAINQTAIIIEITNASNTGDFPQIFRVYTGNDGKATFNFSEWSSSGCFNMKVLYCPFCTDESSHCGFAECLSFSGIHNESGYYTNIDPATEIASINDIEAQGSVPAGDLNNGTYLPQVTLSSYCAPPAPNATTPAMCLPLVLVFALLGGALYLSGQNPFGIFNLGSPRIGKHIRYQARARGFSFSLMSVIQAAASIASTANAVSKAKENAKKEGKEMSTGDAIKKVETQRASNNVFLVSGIGRVGGGIDGLKKGAEAAKKEGGSAATQQMRAAAHQSGGGGGGSTFVGGQLRMAGEGGLNTGAGLMQKWGGGTGASGYFGKLGAGLATIGLGLISSMPAFSCMYSAFSGGKQADLVAALEKAGVSTVAGAQEKLKEQIGSDGRPKQELPDGTSATMEMKTQRDASGNVSGTVVDVRTDGKSAEIVMDGTGKVTAITTTAPADAKNPETGKETPEQKVTVTAPDASGQSRVVVTAEVKGEQATQAAAAANPGATLPEGTTVREGANGEKVVTIASGPNAGTYTVGTDGKVTQTQEYTQAADGTVTRAATGPEATAITALAGGGTPAEGQKVTTTEVPGGGKQIQVEGGPNAGTYTVDADGSVTKTLSGNAADSVNALAKPALDGGVVGGFKVNEVPTMPVDRWAGQLTQAEIAEMQKKGETVLPEQKAVTFMEACQDTMIRVTDAASTVTAAAQAGAQDRRDAIADAIDTPKGKEMVAAAGNAELSASASLALGRQVDSTEAGRIGTGVAATVNETTLYRGGFGQEAVTTSWDAHNPLAGLTASSREKQDTLQRAGAIVDQVVAGMPLTQLEGMSAGDLRIQVGQRVGGLTGPDLETLGTRAVDLAPSLGFKLTPNPQVEGAFTVAPIDQNSPAARSLMLTALAGTDLSVMKPEQILGLVNQTLTTNANAVASGQPPTLTPDQAKRVAEVALPGIDFSHASGNVREAAHEFKSELTVQLGGVARTDTVRPITSETVDAIRAMTVPGATLPEGTTVKPGEKAGDPATVTIASGPNAGTYTVGQDNAHHLLETTPTQFGILRESANGVAAAREDPTGQAALDLVLRNPSQLDEKLQPVVAEYHTYKAAEIESGQLKSSVQEGNYGQAEQRTYETMNIDLTHGVTMGVERVTEQQVETLDEKHRALVPPEYETMKETYRDGFVHVGEANGTEARFMAAGLLDPSDPGSSPVANALDRASKVERSVNDSLTVYELPPDQQGPQKHADFDQASAALAAEAQRYRQLGLDDVAQAYSDALIHVSEARTAPNSEVRDQHLEETRQELRIISLARATPKTAGPQGPIYEAVTAAVTSAAEADDFGRGKIREADKLAETVRVKVEEAVEKQAEDRRRRSGD